MQNDWMDAMRAFVQQETNILTLSFRYPRIPSLERGHRRCRLFAARLVEGVDLFEATCRAVRPYARSGDIAGACEHRGLSGADLAVARRNPLHVFARIQMDQDVQDVGAFRLEAGDHFVADQVGLHDREVRVDHDVEIHMDARS